METLLKNENIDYLLVGDQRDPQSSIEPWSPPSEKFILAPCKTITRNLLWQTGLIGLAVRRDIDVIIFLGNVNFLSTWVAAVLAKLFKKRILFWTHGWLRAERGLKAIVRRTFYRLADGLLLYGNRAKRLGVTSGFAASQMYVVYNSLDYQLQKQLLLQVTADKTLLVRQRLFTNPNLPVIIYTGRLTKTKDLPLLIRAIALLEKSGCTVRLLLVGDGPEHEPLRHLAQELGVTVHFYGPCYDEHVLSELIMSSNMTVTPGPIGLTAMHSLAYGTPVITHDDPDDQGPEWEAIIPGQTGDLFRRGDVHDLATVIQKWSALPWPNESIREQCKLVIDQYYNPKYQESVIDRAVAGLPAE